MNLPCFTAKFQVLIIPQWYVPYLAFALSHPSYHVHQATFSEFLAFNLGTAVFIRFMDFCLRDSHGGGWS